MPVCRIVGTAIPDPYRPHGTAATFRCQTHDMDMGSVTVHGDRCAIGKIEDATEAAIKRIDEAAAKVRI
jgi:hypothetical protein